MAPGSLPAPGTELGPCDTPCKHPDCATSRRMAAALCPYCRGPIGYETLFYRLDDNTTLAHAKCHEEAIEKERTKYPPAP